jgi:hypothetical protein
MGTEAPSCKTMLSEKKRGRLTAAPLADDIAAGSPLAAGSPQRTAAAVNRAIFQDVKCMIYYALKQSAIVKSASTAGQISYGWLMKDGIREWNLLSPPSLSNPDWFWKY